MTATNEYARSRDGSVVHRATCRRLGKTALPWYWAQGKTPDEIRAVAKSHGVAYLWCKSCFGEAGQ